MLTGEEISSVRISGFGTSPGKVMSSRKGVGHSIPPSSQTPTWKPTLSRCPKLKKF